MNWLPIGGFVKLEGEDGDRSGDPRAFSAQSLPVRLLILVSGVVMNVVLAFDLCRHRVARIAAGGHPLPEVEPGSPAAHRSSPGDAIVAIDGQRYLLMAGPAIIQGLREHAGDTVVLTIDSPDGARRDVTVTLRDGRRSPQGGGPRDRRQHQAVRGLFRWRHDDQ